MSHYDSLVEKISKQQETVKNSPAWMIGEQLKEVAGRSAMVAELLDGDIEVTGMKLTDAAAHFAAYAEKHKSGGSFCIIPTVAEQLLREFYKIPAGEAEKKPTETAAQGLIEVADFF